MQNYAATNPQPSYLAASCKAVSPYWSLQASNSNQAGNSDGEDNSDEHAEDNCPRDADDGGGASGGDRADNVLIVLLHWRSQCASV